MTEFPTIIRKIETARRVGLSVRHLERLESEGRFPPRVRLSKNSSGWVSSEVEAWLNQRIAASRSPAAARSGGAVSR